MKIQDLLFIIVLCVLVFFRNGRMSAKAGLACIILSIPLFALKTSLFTAERLTMYAAGMLTLSLIQQVSFRTQKT